MKPNFTLAVESDTGLLVELMREFYEVEHLHYDDEAARRALRLVLNNSIYGVVYIINSDEKVIGYVALTFGFSLEFHGRDALVDELYVREAYRGRGIGRAALSFVEDVCLREDIRAVHLEVDRVNTIAQGLYGKAGYKNHDRFLLTKWIEKKNEGNPS